MPRKKNIYVKDNDVELFAKAEEELGESLSAIVADCLRQKLKEKAVLETLEAQKMERIVVRCVNKELTTISKSFTGKWLVWECKPEDGDGDTTWSVAITQKSNLVAYWQNDRNDQAAMLVFRNLEELKGSDEVPKEVIAQTAEELGEEYTIELDI
jgi:hypothetical protein